MALPLELLDPLLHLHQTFAHVPIVRSEDRVGPLLQVLVAALGHLDQLTGLLGDDGGGHRPGRLEQLLVGAAGDLGAAQLLTQLDLAGSELSLHLEPFRRGPLAKLGVAGGSGLTQADDRDDRPGDDGTQQEGDHNDGNWHATHHDDGV